jgi:hypothetical protein
MPTEAKMLEGMRKGRDCPDRAAGDEPVFILRAQDILAPRVVVRWAHLAEQANVPLNKVQAALKLAKEMTDWQAKHPSRVKVPD